MKEVMSKWPFVSQIYNLFLIWYYFDQNMALKSLWKILNKRKSETISKIKKLILVMTFLQTFKKICISPTVFYVIEHISVTLKLYNFQIFNVPSILISTYWTCFTFFLNRCTHSKARQWYVSSSFKILQIFMDFYFIIILISLFCFAVD